MFHIRFKAAIADFLAPQVVALDRSRAGGLRSLLDEEVEAWKQCLQWDYRPSSELIYRFMRMDSLGGFVLLLRGKPVGYVYHVIEDRKSTIGGLFVTEAHRTQRNENLLLEAALQELFKTPGVHRVQAQLMLLSDPMSRRYPRPESLQIYERDFMNANLDVLRGLDPATLPQPVTVESWTTRSIDESAGLITRSYENHVDSRINDLYRTPGGSRKFLENIVQYPGCGSFHPPASYAARDAVTGRLKGVILSSVVAAETGHVTQICVAPEAQGTGLGYELLRRSFLSMAQEGLQKVSLTVTSSNRAVRLYQRMGFAKQSAFGALVWDGF